MDGEVNIPRIGVTWKEIWFTAESRDINAFTLNGQLKSGQGKIKMNGNVHYPIFGQRFFQMNLNGDRFELVKVPEVWMIASPDVEIEVKGDDIKILGEVGIPEANIEPKDLSGSVQVSPDVKIVGEEEKDRTDRKIYSKVRITLGDQVHFSGFGLKARIKGGILVQEEPEKLTSGTGEIQVLDGKYKAYGQDLEIDRGRLIFADSPLENPGLDIQAVRKIDDITAGVNIGGRLKSPQLNLFSNPSMEQADILSYILLGRPIRQASRSEGKTLQNAATSAGIAGGGFLAKKIGTLFGLEEVEIEKGDTQESTALFVGKYLSPKIFLAYGVGLFEPVNTFRVRYQVNRQLFFQTEHGVESGADILFQVEP